MRYQEEVKLKVKNLGKLWSKNRDGVGTRWSKHYILVSFIIYLFSYYMTLKAQGAKLHMNKPKCLSKCGLGELNCLSEKVITILKFLLFK